jgi:DNA ligase 1
VTLLAELVATSAAVAATTKRSEKVAALAGLLAQLQPDEIAPATAFLTGQTRQGRIGVGWATLKAVQPQPATEPSLTVADLDTFIGDLQVVVGTGSTAERHMQLAGLFERATAAEADFLHRLLLGDLRQGALEGLMLDAIAKGAGVPATSVRRAAMLAGDIPATARIALTEGEAGLDAVHLKVLNPVLPMLAATAASVGEAVVACGRASVEWKLDGARIQAHRRGDEVRLFTRNLNEVTNRLGGVVDVVRGLPVDDIILDGEVIGMAEEDASDTFQDTMSSFGRRTQPGGERLGVWFFDCLHVDGADLIDLPLEQRLVHLERVAGPWRVTGTITDDPAVAASVLDQSLAAGHEGVMVKGADSSYEAGRRGKSWRKVKPVRTFDLVVLAAEWGHGRRQGWLSNLHLGARDPSGGFVMVGKTFKGLTDQLLTWQTEQFLARETGRRGIVVDIRPELVVEIALDGVQRSTRYAGGVALRFARVKRYRPDKSPAEADTIDDLRGLLARPA